MAELFVMPQASPTMEVGTILSWRKEEGAALSPQDVLAEVETDKAAMEIEVFERGYLLRILVPAGEEVPAGTPIAILGSSPDEDISALLAQVSAAARPAPAPTAAPGSTPARAPAPAPAPVAPVAPAPAPPQAAGLVPPSWMGQPLPDAIMEMPTYEPASQDLPATTGAGRSSPASRRAARERGLDIARIPGSGPKGRVTVSDVEGFTAPAGPRLALPGPAAAPADVEVRNSQMRKTISRRLLQAWQEAPSFFLTVTLDCDRLVDLRAQLKAVGSPVSPNDMVVKAVALALRQVPEVNASWGDQAITRHGGVHVGVAVALEDGLITPVVRDADRKSLATIAAEVRDLAGRARDRKLQAHEYQGSTFTISNLGMMGIEHFTAILNPPEAAILAVGALQQVPVAREGQLGLGWRMKVTMTCDHRVIDGALGARFLEALRRMIEQPVLLLT